MSAFASIAVQAAPAQDNFAEIANYTAITTALATNGAGTATFGGYFVMPGADCKYLIIAHNSAASGTDKAVTIKAGNGIQGNKDLSKTDIGYGEYTFLVIDSGRFKNTEENEELKTLSSATTESQVSAKGKVFITGTSADIKVAVFRLP